ncbi:efflux RND transporter periplasmic adaptor subunit [Limnohabitans sp.]|uniref:efflux RND transporter periplasmic adaptor subunit n=1 Tax=Limnohabitans sp. TaxID=1907725 RepID=UPI0038BAEBE5
MSNSIGSKVLSGLTLCCFLGAGFGHAQTPATQPKLLALDAKQQAALGVQVATPQAASAAQLLASAMVNTLPGKDVTVSAPYPGQLSRLWVGVGDRVKAGAPLAQFTSPMLGEARRQWQEAQLELKNANSALQRDQAMLDEGIIPAVRVQLTRSKQAAAQALVQAREAELRAAGISANSDRDNTSTGGYASGTLTAPIGGVVTQAFAAVGQRVEPGAVLFKLADDSSLQLDIQLASDKAAQLQVGDAVSVPSREAQAKIVGVSRAVDASQLAKARAVVTHPGRLQVGEVVVITVQAKTLSPTSNATRWLLPARALTPWNNQSLVFVRQSAGFTAQPVRVLSSNDDMALVEANWPANAQVAISGIAALRALLQKDE